MNLKTLKKNISNIAKIDDDVAQALKEFGYPEPRIRPPGFETFLSTIVSQQISTKAAASILAKVRALLPTVDAKTLLQLSDKDLREAGLSQRKMEYAQGLAKAIVSGEFIPKALADMDNQSAIEHIVRLRGFGRWSAEIYLMFSLGRRDIFPADDLVLQLSLQRLKNLATKPTPKVARQAIEHWTPWRSAGSLFLWHYHHSNPPTI